MKLVGLGGGIGSGKSTVSLLLAERGAVIVDADVIARSVVEPGGPCLRSMVERFGAGILHPDGTLNRAEMASKVFGHPEELAALNNITHPAIAAEIGRQIGMHAGTDHVVILDAALLFGSPGRRGGVEMVGRMLVDVETEIAICRLVQFRNFTEADARARIASQMSRDERLALADFVIDNSGDRSRLEARVDDAWDWIAQLRDSAESSPENGSGTLSDVRPTMDR
jgi:dephospho-CoA kinase